MKQFVAIMLVMVLAVTGCNSSKVNSTNSQVNTLSQQEKNDGWKLLFDGKTTEGWHTYGRQSAGSVWAVDDGAIHLDPKLKKQYPSDGGDIVTNDAFGNFHLKIDWKISPKGNSGIIFYIHEDAAKFGNTYETGMEMQVLDNGTPTRAGHDDAKLYTHRAGDLYDLLAAKEAVNPQGEWNHAEIKSKDGQLDFYLNGEHTLTTHIWDANWKDMIANSKFRTMAGFGTYKEGKISLQDHGDEVWYRNIKIKSL